MKPKRTILCVDDNEQSLSIRKVMLETRGYRVVTCASGEEALKVFENGGIDLVLTDVVMPDMGGPELVDSLLEKWPGMRVIYMSGYAQGDKMRVEMKERDTSFLQKPFSADSLILTVREVLDQETPRTF